MNRIHVLEDHIINKIAAGEVVERPASVLKELVENALDAGASRISVALEEGGKARITVRDDGFGMSAEDAVLALKRHATSKIASADDLFQIASLGFRGEALASIASVSRLSLCSRERPSPLGIKLVGEGGHFEAALPWEGPAGTSLSISDLFFNVPARAKFLKSASSEFGHCLELLQSIAMARPDVSFTLTHNGKEKLQCAAVPTIATARAESTEPSFLGEEALRARAGELWGEEVVTALLYTQEESQFGRFEGLISPPGVEKATSKFMLSYVNRRWVQDKVIRYGVLRGYQSHLLKGRYPQALIFFHCDPGLVDVNVHPAKTELRFQYSAEVQGLLAAGIRRAIRQGVWASPQLLGEAGFSADTKAEDEVDGQGEDKGEGHLEPQWRDPRGSSPSPLSFKRNYASPAFAAASESVKFEPLKFKATSSHAVSKGLIDHDLSPTRKLDRAEPFELAPQAEPRVQSSGPEVIPWDELQLLGCLRRCYLFFEWRSFLLTVDQHAWHERILFERLLADRSLLLQSQPLMIPEVIETTAQHLAYLQETQSHWQEAGFSLRFIGEQALEVHAVPTILSGKNLEALFAAVVKPELQGSSAMETNAVLGSQLLATLACHAAVRAGEELTPAEIQSLISDARKVDFYHNCPHGRRVFKWHSKAQVEAWFDRN